MNATTIQVTLPIRQALEKLKLYKRETYNEVLQRMITEMGLEEEEVSEAELREIRAISREMDAGKAVPWRRKG